MLDTITLPDSPPRINYTGPFKFDFSLDNVVIGRVSYLEILFEEMADGFRT